MLSKKESEAVKMVKMPKKVLKAIEDGSPFSLATASKKGKPNVIYVGCLKALDSQTILVADNYFKKTKKNLIQNNKVDFCMLDEKAKSYQIKGTAEYLTEGKYYEEVRGWCDKKHPRKAAVLIHVKEVYNGAEKIA